MSNKRAYTRHSQETKQMAINLYVDDGYSMMKISGMLGISHSTLGVWLKPHNRGVPRTDDLKNMACKLFDCGLSYADIKIAMAICCDEYWSRNYWRDLIQSTGRKGTIHGIPFERGNRNGVAA